MNTGDRPVTARLTPHARARCAEMHVETKRVKRLLRRPTLTYATYADRLMATSEEDPEIAVVFAKGPDGTLDVITVLVRSYDEYSR
jgi:hypothetical protein